MAQSILAPPPAPPSLVPSAVQDYQTNGQMQVFSPSAPGQPEDLSQPFQCGPVTLRPHVSYQFLYGNGIQSEPGQPQDTIVQEFSPGILFDIGTHWTLDYTPTLNFYSSSQFHNTVDHSVQLQWGSAFRDWFVSASQGYVNTSDPEAQTAGQTDQQTYSTALNAVYHFNDKLSADLGLAQSINDFGQTSTNLSLGLSNSRNWSTMDWLYDQLWSRFNAGVGVGFGYNQQQGSPDSIDQEYQASLNWRITDKVSFSINGGLEDQEFLSGGASDILTPIFGGSLQYQPFEQTRFSVSANRTVTSSYYQNEVVENTSITADFNQRLFGGIYLDLNGSYMNSSYVTSNTGLSTARNDDSYTFSASLTFPFPKRGTFSILYLYSDNSSTQNGFAPGQSAFSFSSSQIGFQIGYTY
ncbi:MAG TPA: outer membrane beta-barrel protein [Candidatus Acidoferrales bacterium]|jgi:hypothetical protein|nr:outer membrane beta-barrel protein [Candidatus Acidoferrales bacterium]